MIYSKYTIRAKYNKSVSRTIYTSFSHSTAYCKFNPYYHSISRVLSSPLRLKKYTNSLTHAFRWFCVSFTRADNGTFRFFSITRTTKMFLNKIKRDLLAGRS